MDGLWAGERADTSLGHAYKLHKVPRGEGEALLGDIIRPLAARGALLRDSPNRDATIIDAPASTQNRTQQRGPARHRVKEGNQWDFGMKAHIGVGAQTGLVHSVATAANVADVTQVPQLLHGGETRVWGDAGDQGVARRPEHRGRAMDWQVARRPGQRRRLAPGSAAAQAEQRKASIRAKVEHLFLYVKRHFGYATMRYRGLAKNRNRLYCCLGWRTCCSRRARVGGSLAPSMAPKAT